MVECFLHLLSFIHRDHFIHILIYLLLRKRCRYWLWKLESICVGFCVPPSSSSFPIHIVGSLLHAIHACKPSNSPNHITSLNMAHEILKQVFVSSYLSWSYIVIRENPHRNRKRLRGWALPSDRRI